MADSEEYLYEVASRLDGEVWETIFLMLQTRAGNACEARTEDCLAGPRGDLSSLTRDRVSIHHRMPRKAGGTRDARLNTLSRLMLVCGTGTTGCHHWIEQHRIIGRDRGWLIPRLVAETVDSTTVPMHAAGVGVVLLSDDAPVYRPYRVLTKP